MPVRTVVIGSRSGLHARPARIFVEAAARQPVAVRIRVGDRPAADARSMLSVLALGAGHGAEAVLEADDGPHADAALDELATLLARDLDEEVAAHG